MAARTASVDVGSRNGSRTSELVAQPRAIADVSSECLVARIAEGDEHAFAELYDRFGRPAFALAYRVLRDRDLAADAVQEGFLGLWRSAGCFRPGRGTARTFLLTFVHRRAVDCVRHEERGRRSLHESAEWRVDDHDDLAASLERERVRAALSRLPHRCREAIELAYYDGFTQQEIALHLRVPLGTVKTRTAHGLRTLAKVLREDENARESAPAQRQLAARARH